MNQDEEVSQSQKCEISAEENYQDSRSKEFQQYRVKKHDGNWMIWGWTSQRQRKKQQRTQIKKIEKYQTWERQTIVPDNSSVVLTTQCFGISISFMFMAIDIDTTAGGKSFDESQATIKSCMTKTLYSDFQ